MRFFTDGIKEMKVVEDSVNVLCPYCGQHPIKEEEPVDNEFDFGFGNVNPF